MQHKFLKLAGVKTEKEFYKKFPSEEAFFKAFPEAMPTVDEFGDGGSIHIKPSKVGTLHTALGVPQGEKIPASKLTIHEGDSSALKKKKQFAINARKWEHEEGGTIKPIDYKCGGKMTGKKAAWGAALGTDQFVGGPDPVNPFPQGFKTTPLVDAQGTPMRPPISGGTVGSGISGGGSAGTQPGLTPITGGVTNGSARGATPISGGISSGVAVGAPPMSGGVSNSEAVKPGQKPPQVKMPEGKGAEGSGGQAALMGLMAVSALMPKEKIRRRYVRPEDMESYNPNTYGTGSQAISEYGNTLKGKKKKAFWGAVIGAVAGKAQAHEAESKKNLFNNVQEGLAPLMMVSDKAQQEANRLDNLYLSGGVQNMQNLQQSQQQFLPNQQAQYMENGGEILGQGGELQTGKGGHTELKSYNPYDGGTFQFNGASHDDGGIEIDYKGQSAEVEGQETAFKDQEGDLKIMGNLKNPLTGRKYKDDLKKIANKEQKAQKLIDKGTMLINAANPDDSIEALAFNSGRAMTIGGLIRQKQLAQSKQHLGNMQEAHLEIANEKKQSPEKAFAEKGATLSDPEPKKKWAYKDTNIGKLDPKIREFADMLAAKGIGGYSGARGGYREGSKTTSGRKSRHSRNEALDLIPIDGQASYNKILNDPELVNYLMTNGLTVIDEYAPDVAKKTGATAGHLHVGKDKGTTTADKFRKDVMSLYPNKYNTKINDKYVEPAFNQGVGDAGTENHSTFINKPYTIPNVHFTPKLTDIQTVQGDGTPLEFNQPAPLDKPSNARGISPMQFLGEGYALATNREEPVRAQLYTPELYSPYQVSFQDRLNENQATFNAVEKQVAYDPTSLATLAGQKYQANSAVLADEFRTNQGIANDIINKNVSLLNDAEMKNLGILDQQFVRQSQARSNTRRINQDALSSVSSKILQKEANNNMLRVYENMYPNYAFNKKTGKAEFYGAKPDEAIDWSGVQPLTAGQPTKTVVKTSPTGQKTTTDTFEPFNRELEPWKIAPKKATTTSGSIFKMFRN